MAKAILVIDIPKSCRHITAEVVCENSEEINVHNLNYSKEEIIRRRCAYEVLKEHLNALKVD